MFKKFISIATAALVLAAGQTLFATPSASAATISDATATSTGAIGTSGTNTTPIVISATLVTSGAARTYFLNLPTGWSFATTPNSTWINANITTNLSGYRVQAIGTGFVVLAGASSFASNTEVTITFAANALNVGSNRIFTVQFVDDRTGTAITIDTGTATLAGGGSTPAPSAPTQTAAEIAAAAATAAKAAAEVAAAVRAAEVAVAQTKLSTVLKADKAGTQSEYRAANINVTTDASLARINAEVLKLSENDRTDFAKIKAIAEKIEFDESFFNATARPTLSTFAKYEVVGITERILSTVNAKVLELPAALRADAKAIQDLVKIERFVDLVANTETRGGVTSASLIERGLLPADTPYKHSVRTGLGLYPEGSLNTMEKIEAAIKAELLKAGARKAQTAEIRARIAARNK
jgi:hypothetical protein